jgi:hypothetical protein
VHLRHFQPRPRFWQQKNKLFFKKKAWPKYLGPWHYRLPGRWLLPDRGPLRGAAANGRSNFFPNFSPDGL